MVLDRELTIQELLFNTAIEKFETGGMTMDLDNAQFHDDPNFFDKIEKHFGKYWGWYASAAAIGIVAYYSIRAKEKETKRNSFNSFNGFIPFPNFTTPPIKINTKPIASIRMYIDEAKSKQINAH